MANWHVRAVMERRKEYESEEYTKDYDIVMAIAVHIGEDDSPAVMSIAAIARYAGCHYNTVDKRTKVLAAEGKLAIGPGHGKMLAYNLPFESKRALSDERPPAPAAEQDETKSLREEVRQLREVVAELSESVKHLHTAITTSSHSHHTDVTSHQSDYVKKVEKKKRSKESPLPPLNGTAIDRRIKAILDVCGLQADIPQHRREAENAAVQLDSYNAAHIYARYGRGDTPDWNWFRDDWRGQKGQLPTPKQVVQYISQTRPEPVSEPAANGNGTNGHTPNPGESAWTAVMEQLRAGRWTLPRDGPETQALNRAGGWAALRNTQERELDFFKRRFLDAYQATH